jgi:hypothetical protein
MSLEEIYSDLEAIAKKRGPLDEEAVLSATAILARPRYAKSESPCALLVEDLEHVIASIPNYPSPEASPPWASQNFRGYARRYFSLDAAGQTLSNRRAFGRKEPGGSVLAWMHRGVLYRVAAGLIELWASADEPSTALPVPGHRIEALQVIKHFNPDGSARNIVKCELHAITSGIHVLVLPLAAQSATLLEFDAEHLDSRLAPQVVELDGIPKSSAAVLFSVEQPATDVRLKVNQPTRDTHTETCLLHVDALVEKLILEVDITDASAKYYRWQVRREQFGQVETIAEPPEGRWRCDNPEPGGYCLEGIRLTPSERRKVHGGWMKIT